MNRLKFLKTMLAAATAAVTAPILPKRTGLTATTLQKARRQMVRLKVCPKTILIPPEYEAGARKLVAEFEGEEGEM